MTFVERLHWFMWRVALPAAVLIYLFSLLLDATR